MQDRRIEQLLEDDPELAEQFFGALKDLVKIWPIYGFRCNGQPYVTNAEAISREVRREKAGDGE